MATEHRSSHSLVPSPQSPSANQRVPGGARRATPARRGLLGLRDEWLLARRFGREHPRGPQAGDAVVIDVAGANPTLRTSARKGAHTYYLSSEHLLKVR